MAANSKRNTSVNQTTSPSTDDSTVTKAKDALRSVGTVDTGDTFDKAWERVYGSKEYRPSWVGKLEGGKGGRRKLPPPPKAYKPKAIKEEPKPAPKPIEKPAPIARKVSSQHTAGIPNQFRAKKTPAPLIIDGKIAPKEKELEKWRKDIASDDLDKDGNPVYNKVVKKTNIKGWMNNNSYWQAQEQPQISPPVKPKKRERILPPKNQTINKEKYDLVGQYENTVRNADLKLGASAIPKEVELKRWGDELEIPDDALAEDYTAGRGPDKKSQHRGLDGPRGRSTRVSHPQPSTKSKKWNAVLKTADVPTFFTKNTFWES